MQKIKLFLLSTCLVSSALWYKADAFSILDGHHPIQVMEAQVQNEPRGSSIHAFTDGHYLTVSFSQNFGPVAVVVTTASGVLVDSVNLFTSIGWQFYIPDEGDYVVTFTFIDGDEYYGEFSITD